jgi:ribosome maturation factor RimP
VNSVATVEEVANRIAADAGLTLYDIDRQGGTLVVLLDRTGGVDVDALAAASRALAKELDEAGLIAASTTLEVSSPGLERRLRTPAHFRGAVDARVTISLREELDGQRRLLGTLSAVDGDELVLTLDDGSTRTVAMDQIDRARTVFEWGGSPPPGSSNQRQRARRNSEANT